MKRTVFIIALVVLGFAALAAGGDVRMPEKISKIDIGGAIFERPDMLELTHDGKTTLDVTTFMSSDSKFGTGMYKSGATRIEINEAYGVDEFMYFLEGGVTLTSSDGTVTEIEAGDAVTISKEWTGIWDTDGYTKIWVIYSADGSGL